MPRIQTLSPATLAEQQQMLRWWRQVPRSGRSGEVSSPAIPNERHIRWARTTTDASYPAYPTGKVIACELGEYTFDDSAVADVSATFTAYSPAEIRYAYFQFGWRPEGSIVRLTLHDGKWFCLDEGGDGGHSVIRFRVISLAPYTDEVSSPCEAVIAEVLSVSCQSSSVSVGDEVTIYDPSNCWFNVPIEVLEGASGQAVLMEAGVYEQVPDCVEASEEGCWWLVQHLCCTEELYAN